MKTFLPILFLVISAVSARAVEVRIATFNVLTGIGASGQNERTALESVLARIDADILCLQEVISSDFNDGHLADIASNLGYGSIFVPTTALDTGSRVIILSKFPFAPGSTRSIVSPAGANDVTRAAAAAIVDVPGTTNDPVIVTAHLKCCFENDDPFRRAIEMQRIRNYLDELGVDENDNVFVMGDFNLLGNDFTFSALPSGLPVSYRLGDDISFDVQYYSDPTRYFTGLGLTNPGYRQQNGITTDTFMGSDTILDYLLVSNSVASRVPSTEIYNSLLESSFPGLPKSGSPLPPVTSSNASDHYPVYGDFDLDDGLALNVSVSPAILDEDSPPATVTVTLAVPAATTTTLTLQSSDPGEAILGDTSIEIPAGASMATTTLIPRLDKISDGTQSVDILVNAAGYQGDQVSVSIRDADPQIYLLQSASQPLLEDFEEFQGTQSLAAWQDGGITWVGNDDGTINQFGGRSYQGSLGIFTAEPTTFETTIRNGSGQTIESLEVSYDAQHWRRLVAGSADRIEVSIVQDGTPRRLPELDFTPSTSGTPGTLSPPEQVNKSIYLRALDFKPNEQFQLIFQIIPGTLGGVTSSDAFINEFHYDNGQVDVGEFVEIFVGSAFSGNLSDITLQFYNGNNGSSYGNVENLTTFIEGPSNGPGSPRIFYKEIPEIQNGAPDGIALAINGVVREFLSYEGSFTATDGIAAGMASTDVGVSQSPITPAGRDSIARSGTGGMAEDFTWGIQPGPHTPGQLNAGQSVGASPSPQGMAIDNFRITPLLDSDGDSLPDQEEIELGTNPFLADTDGDGQSDFFETVLTDTNPLSGSSSFKTKLTVDGNIAQVSFPSLIGRSYQVETSADLSNWTSSSAQAGTGQNLAFEATRTDTLFFRVKISRP